MELQTLQIHIRITYKDISKLSRLQNSAKYERKTSMYLHTYVLCDAGYTYNSV